MRLAQFIREILESVLEQWEAFARSCLPAGGTMTQLALRDHAALRAKSGFDVNQLVAEHRALR